MSFCIHCGTQVPQSAGFCPNCGTAVAQAAGQAITPRSDITPSPKPINWGLWIAIIVIAGFVILGSYLLYIFYYLTSLRGGGTMVPIYGTPTYRPKVE